MKKYCLLAAIAAAFAGCMKEMPVNSGKNDDGFSKMVVSGDFDWTTTSDVACNIASDGVARVAVATSAAAEPFAVFFAGGGLEPVTLNVPAAANTLYMSYETTGGGMSAPQAVPVASNAVSFALGGNSRPFDDSDMEMVENTIYVPARANGWGTMMFEDLWPSYGDYDFNDFVFNYQVEINLTGSNKAQSMRIGIRMKAVSGSLPYELYLKMHGVTYDKIKEVERSSEKNPASAALTLLEPTDPIKNRALFRFDGIKKNPNNPSGAIWVNTEPGYELSEDQLVEVAYTIHFKSPILLENLNFAGLDFFIGQMEDGKLGAEIHRCNYEPINQNYYMSVADPSVRDYYKSKDNLIWAVNIPADISHTYEKSDLLKAYPDFRAWVQSVGTKSKDWYTKGDDQYLVRKR